MLEMVEARKNADKVEERYDLFSGLLDAARDEPDSEVALTDEELFGGISTSPSFSIVEERPICLPRKHVYVSFCWARGAVFLFILSRWRESSSLQTTAHTLCFSFALLALYPDEQERLYQHIKGVMSTLSGMPVGSRNPNSDGELTPL